MEKLTNKKQNFVASINALDRSIKVCMRTDLPDFLQEQLVASLIKHYEMCYEAAWKFLKLYVEKKYEERVDSPKKVIRLCYDLKLINEKTTRELLDISDDRNLTCHGYNEETAKQICARVNSYYETLKILESIPLDF